MNLPDTLENTSLHMDDSIHRHFKEIIAWSKFLGIAGMILAVLALVFSFALGARIESALNSGFMNSGTAGFLVIFFILLFAGAYFMLSLFLYRFATNIQLAIETCDKYEFVNAMRNLRNTYKIMGILFTIYVSVFLINSVLYLIKLL